MAKVPRMHCGHVTLCREKMYIVVYGLFTELNSDRIITLTFQLSDTNVMVC